MHPIDHISIPKEYEFYPNIVSGALYHNVYIGKVKGFIGILNYLASKNPDINTFSFLFIKIL